MFRFFYTETPTHQIYTFSLHDALPIYPDEWKPKLGGRWRQRAGRVVAEEPGSGFGGRSYCLSQREPPARSEEHTSELQSRFDLVCRLLLVKKSRSGV